MSRFGIYSSEPFGSMQEKFAQRSMIMAVIENLSKENVKSVLNNLYVEAKREPDRLCSPAEERRRMASIRQQIKIVTLFLDECRYEEVEDQVRYVERLVKGQQRVAEEVKT